MPLVLALYNLLLPFAALLLLPRQLVKMARRGQFRRHFGQRFARYAPETRAWLLSHPSPVWIHAVSVGEVLIALKLIRALRRLAPDLPLVLSCTTTTGFALAEKHQAADFLPLYRPIDLPFTVSRAFHTIQPRLLVLVESELWPNTLATAARRRIPIVLVNARLSPRSERRFRRFALLSRPLFQRLDLVLTQTLADSARWASLGVPQDRLQCPGSIKFDHESQAPPHGMIEEFRALLRRLRGASTGPVLLAGSTHPGEEKLLGQVFLEVLPHFPDAWFLVVPRHFERGAEVRQDLAALGFTPILKTDLDPAHPTLPPGPIPCLIVNTTGELQAWYHLANLVFIGKTFLSDEGQNPVEPLLAGKPIITGPAMKNFADLFQRLQDAGGCLSVPSLDQLAPATLSLLQDPARQRLIVERGSALVASDQGASTRSAHALLHLLSAAKSSPAERKLATRTGIEPVLPP